MLNMFEKLEKYFKNHYTINSSNIETIGTFEKKLIKLEKYSDEINLNLHLEKLLINVANQYDLTQDISTRIDTIIYGEQTEIIEDPFKENLTKNKKSIELSETDKLQLESSNKEFKSNYQFNVMLNYILSL
jgi:hypothetical protein